MMMIDEQSGNSLQQQVSWRFISKNYLLDQHRPPKNNNHTLLKTKLRLSAPSQASVCPANVTDLETRQME